MNGSGLENPAGNSEAKQLHRGFSLPGKTMEIV
jgi:hypothetical protein